MTAVFHNAANRLRSFERLVPLAAAFLFTAPFFSGAPILRHDWPSPYPSAVTIVGALSGWNPAGMGGPVGYPASFIAAPAEYALLNVFGPAFGTILWQFAVATVCAYGAYNCTRLLTANAAAHLAAPIFALFNPWVYTQVVAGHVFMLLGYAALFWLWREALSKTAEWRMILIALLLTPQIQFFVLCTPAFVYVAARRRYTGAIATWLLLALPVVVGVIMARSSLISMPLAAEWERQQSISPTDVVLLSGYFARYWRPNALAVAAEWTVFSLALLSAIFIVLRDRKQWTPIAMTVAAFIVAIAVKAPWGNAFAWLFQHIPESGLLRELYDVVGFAAVGYMVLIAILSRRHALFGYVWIAATLAIGFAWLLPPPSHYWVVASAVPRAAITQAPNTRFALIPAFSPMQFRGVGSGADPDAFTHAGDITPVNQALSPYPAGAALSRYLLYGDTRSLAGLSVSKIYARAYLNTDVSVEYQWALQTPRAAQALLHAGSAEVQSINALPEMTVSSVPAVGSGNLNIGAGNVFFSDARAVSGESVPRFWVRFGKTFAIQPDKEYVNAADGWVDARFVFEELPNMAQPFGGVATTSPSAELTLSDAHEALVNVDGTLLNDRSRKISGTTHGYRWIIVPKGTRAVRCVGICVVALQGDPPNVPIDPPAQPFTSVQFSGITPWLQIARVAPGPGQLLRYNVTFDRHWIAFVNGRVLPHVRVDAIVNGWLMPSRRTSSSVYIVEYGAALVSFTEVIAVVGLAIVFLCAIASSRRESS